MKGGDGVGNKGRKGNVEEREKENRMNVRVESGSRASEDTDRSGDGSNFAGGWGGGDGGGHIGGKGSQNKLRAVLFEMETAKLLLVGSALRKAPSA